MKFEVRMCACNPRPTSSHSKCQTEGTAAAADLVSPADQAQVALDGFSERPLAGLQRKVTHAREEALHKAATAAARPDAKMQAFLHSCCGRWVRAERLRFMQLSNEEAVVRMQRYLRLPLSALAGIVGTVAVGSVIDPFGDCVMSGYKALHDGEWRQLHNALCRAISGFASQAHVSNQLEGGKIPGTKKRPGDVRFAGDSGAHGWAKAGANELWIDATVVCPLLPTYVAAASAARGSKSSGNECYTQLL